MFPDQCGKRLILPRVVIFEDLGDRQRVAKWLVLTQLELGFHPRNANTEARNAGEAPRNLSTRNFICAPAVGKARFHALRKVFERVVKRFFVL